MLPNPPNSPSVRFQSDRVSLKAGQAILWNSGPLPLGQGESVMRIPRVELDGEDVGTWVAESYCH